MVDVYEEDTTGNSDDDYSQSDDAQSDNRSEFSKLVDARVRLYEGEDRGEFEKRLHQGMRRDGQRKPRGKAAWTTGDRSNWLTDAMRPNIHLGMHYEQFIRDYALGSNMSTLVGEDQHR
jgi:hypothetical protein